MRSVPRITRRTPALLARALALAETFALQAQNATAGADPHTPARVVAMELTPDSRKALADFTRDCVGNRVQPARTASCCPRSP